MNFYAVEQVVTNSSWLDKIGFGAVGASQGIACTFDAGRTFFYNADYAQYEAFAQADSPGRWFNENLRGTDNVEVTWTDVTPSSKQQEFKLQLTLPLDTVTVHAESIETALLDTDLSAYVRIVGIVAC